MFQGVVNMLWAMNIENNHLNLITVHIVAVHISLHFVKVIENQSKINKYYYSMKITLSWAKSLLGSDWY